MAFFRTGLIILALLGGWMLVRGESFAHMRGSESMLPSGIAAQG